MSTQAKVQGAVDSWLGDAANGVQASPNKSSSGRASKLFRRKRTLRRSKRGSLRDGEGNDDDDDDDQTPAPSSSSPPPSLPPLTLSASADSVPEPLEPERRREPEQQRAQPQPQLQRGSQEAEPVKEDPESAPQQGKKVRMGVGIGGPAMFAELQGKMAGRGSGQKRPFNSPLKAKPRSKSVSSLHKLIPAGRAKALRQASPQKGGRKSPMGGGGPKVPAGRAKTPFLFGPKGGGVAGGGGGGAGRPRARGRPMSEVFRSPPVKAGNGVRRRAATGKYAGRGRGMMKKPGSPSPSRHGQRPSGGRKSPSPAHRTVPPISVQKLPTQQPSDLPPTPTALPPPPMYADGGGTTAPADPIPILATLPPPTVAASPDTTPSPSPPRCVDPPDSPPSDTTSSSPSSASPLPASLKAKSTSSPALPDAKPRRRVRKVMTRSDSSSGSLRTPVRRIKVVAPSPEASPLERSPSRSRTLMLARRPASPAPVPNAAPEQSHSAPSIVSTTEADDDDDDDDYDDAAAAATAGDDDDDDDDDSVEDAAGQKLSALMARMGVKSPTAEEEPADASVSFGAAAKAAAPAGTLNDPAPHGAGSSAAGAGEGKKSKLMPSLWRTRHHPCVPLPVDGEEVVPEPATAPSTEVNKKVRDVVAHISGIPATIQLAVPGRTLERKGRLKVEVREYAAGSVPEIDAMPEDVRSNADRWAFLFDDCIVFCDKLKTKHPETRKTMFGFQFALPLQRCRIIDPTRVSAFPGVASTPLGSRRSSSAGRRDLAAASSVRATCKFFDLEWPTVELNVTTASQAIVKSWLKQFEALCYSDVDTSSETGEESGEGSSNTKVKRLAPRDTVKRVVWDVTEPKNATDPDLLSAFLLTYRSYTQPHVVMELLWERFQWSPDGMETLSTDKHGEAVKQIKKVQLRVFVLFKEWVYKHWDDFRMDAELLQDLKQFARRKDIEGIDILKRLPSLIEQRESKGTLLENKVILLGDPPKPHMPRTLPVSSNFHLVHHVHPTEIARQLTLVEQSLFAGIEPHELLEQKWNKRREEAPHVIAVISTFNHVAHMWAVYIVKEESMKKRVALLQSIIKIAMRCHDMNNWNACMGFVCVFNSAAIRRLKRTWASLPDKYRDYVDNLKTLMDGRNNFKLYREALVHTEPPILPYLGLYLKDLTFIDDGNPNTLKNGDINMSKNRLVAKAILNIQLYQQMRYNFEAVEPLMEFLRQPAYEGSDWTDDEIFAQSLKSEPRG